ncbi:hypothetical protein COV06_01265 [Candidatus Uhrbacteria bacterium CG10_big_fil_rev_8_21_14_0_10_50_16]|uniref:Uncharacterized protein n=1 Tax=Candidatus Uhrbacteria bacterium CG10_big_fil_rev_8_21_14_0_10_50_16 TaxID=1975039 RepID=A0A2H0RN83_9BACT|nr:MAG: hypothetical protein COV06_01265 [Candidatus Uhrbacteria bacterium CG10_big_fil_rev_8_21_14_0_10_50_16]
MEDGKDFYFESVIIHVGDKTVELEHVHSTNRRLQRLMEQGYDIAASLEFTVDPNNQVATQLGLLQYLPDPRQTEVAEPEVGTQPVDLANTGFTQEQVNLLNTPVSELPQIFVVQEIVSLASRHLTRLHHVVVGGGPRSLSLSEATETRYQNLLNAHGLKIYSPLSSIEDLLLV